jgi:hypothetical protein
MKGADVDDPLLRDLSSLSRLAPDAGRAARVRARCGQRLTRGRRSIAGTPAATITRYVAPALVGSLSAGYFAAVVEILIRLRN